MNLYKISQDVNNNWDTYDSAIVCCNDEKEAIDIHPGNRWDESEYMNDWLPSKDKDKIKVELIGVACDNIKKGVVLASFNAG